MAEATSSLTFTDLQLQVAVYLGYTATSGNWSAVETARIARIIARGLRQFYAAYSWSFLEIRTTLATVADDFDYALPDLFGDVILGDMTFSPTDTMGPVVRQDSAEHVRMLLANGQGMTGRPQRFAIETTSLGGGATGLRKQIIFWPIPDIVYTLGYTYRVNQNNISGTNYPVGGAQQAEAIMASCLAVAELDKTNAHGAYYEDYGRILADAIATEKRATAGFVQRDEHADYFDRITTIVGTGT